MIVKKYEKITFIDEQMTKEINYYMHGNFLLQIQCEYYFFYRILLNYFFYAAVEL